MSKLWTRLKEVEIKIKKSFTGMIKQR